MSHQLIRQSLLLLIFLGMLLPAYAPAQDKVAEAPAEDVQLEETINTLQSLLRF